MKPLHFHFLGLRQQVPLWLLLVPLLQVIAQSIISQSVERFTPAKLPRLMEAVLDMERNTRELQEQVMAIRMVPIGTIFGRFSRMVHDLSTKLGKRIHLELEGEETELDKSMVEAIVDPITHLVRNAADHGIETIEERLAARKPEEATIRLAAFHQSGNVVIEVSDDGQGLDPERIRRKAREKGLIGDSEQLTDESLQALIFRPGFSTAATVSDLSGRGVGLDVVKRSIDGLNGSIALRSEPGQGASFRITLPLTLAILDGMGLRVGDQTFLMPLNAIVESFRPAPSQVKTILGKGEVVQVRGDTLPLVRLSQLLHLPVADADVARGLVVIVETGEARFGLAVDELLGQSQVVLKNLETHFRRVDGIMGATITGEGKVALILDLTSLWRQANPERAGLEVAA